MLPPNCTAADQGLVWSLGSEAAAEDPYGRGRRQHLGDGKLYIGYCLPCIPRPVRNCRKGAIAYRSVLHLVPHPTAKLLAVAEMATSQLDTATQSRPAGTPQSACALLVQGCGLSNTAEAV